jgi:hypothetical protein
MGTRPLMEFAAASALESRDADFRIKEAANLLGIGTDTSRHWADGGRIGTTTDAAGRVKATDVSVEIPKIS